MKYVISTSFTILESSQVIGLSRKQSEFRGKVNQQAPNGEVG